MHRAISSIEATVTAPAPNSGSINAGVSAGVDLQDLPGYPSVISSKRYEVSGTLRIADLLDAFGESCHMQAYRAFNVVLRKTAEVCTGVVAISMAGRGISETITLTDAATYAAVPDNGILATLSGTNQVGWLPTAPEDPEDIVWTFSDVEGAVIEICVSGYTTAEYGG